MAERNWRNYLRRKTRNPRFLWKMVFAILAAGIFGGMGAHFLRGAGGGANMVLAPAEGEGAGDGEDAAAKLEALADAGSWREVWWALPGVAFQRMANPAPLVLAAFAGVCWFLFCLQAAQVRGVRDAKLWLMLGGFAMGCLSIWPTHFFSMWLKRPTW